MSSDDLSGDTNQVTDAVRGQVADLQLSVDVGEGDVVLLKVREVRLLGDNGGQLLFVAVL